MTNRNKTVNENIYYNVDIIYNAIAENVKIQFQYFEWDVNKEMHLRRNGKVYEVSPWLLTWDDENYYLIAYDSEAGIIKHYRVDKMLKIELSVEKEKEKNSSSILILQLTRKNIWNVCRKRGDCHTAMRPFFNRRDDRPVWKRCCDEKIDENTIHKESECSGEPPVFRLDHWLGKYRENRSSGAGGGTI